MTFSILSLGMLNTKGASRCLMSSAGDVTSGSITADVMNGNASGRFVLTAEDAARNEAERERSGYNSRYRVCNCSAKGERPKGHSIKCRAHPLNNTRSKGLAKTQGNRKGVRVQLDLTGFVPLKLNPHISKADRNKHSVMWPLTKVY